MYIMAVIMVGGAFGVWLAGGFPSQHRVALVAACILATILQVLKTEGATSRASFNLSWIVYAAVFVQYGMSAAFVVIVAAHLAEWVWYRYPWYVQSFNIASFAIVVSAAGLVTRWSLEEFGLTGFMQVVATMAALAVFTLGNHMLVGQAIRLDRGAETPASFVFSRQTLTLDFGLLCLGAGAAFLWTLNPFTIAFLFVVVYLLHSVLRVPALEREAYRDPKTGLYNAEYMNKQLRKEVPRTRRPERPLCLVMADLDLLREINNTYGHVAGDAVIKKVAQILQALARDTDTVARFGGEEYTVLMPDTTTGEAFIQAEAMRKAIEAAEFTVAQDAMPIKVTMSFGIAECEGANQPIEELLHTADLAMYEAKDAGRNTCCVYDRWTPEIAPLDTRGSISIEGNTTMSKYGNANRSDSHSGAEGGWNGSPSRRGIPKRRHAPSVEFSEVRTGSARAVKLYVLSVAGLAAVLSALLIRPIPLAEVAGLVLFVALAALLEWLVTDDFSMNIAVPTSVAALIASTLLFGPVGAVASSLTIAAVAQVHRRWDLEQFAFRASNQVIGGLLCAGLIVWTGMDYLAFPTWRQIVFASLCALVIYAGNTLLAAGYAGMHSSKPWYQIWIKRYMRQAAQYAAMGLIAFALIYFYLLVGVFGVLIMLVPLALLHYGQREYLNATKQSIDALQQTYEQLATKNREIEKLNEELLLALASTIDLRDPDVLEHSKQVARYAVLTAEELGLDTDHVKLVRRGGLMHDIGKLAIPEAILFKPDRLTEEEYEIVKEHVTIGADLLDDFGTLQSVANSVRHHHERWDGRGYPDGLAGEEIPVEARILALADSVEAMASDRPYRAGMDVDEILAEVRAQSGTQFDPDVVKAFTRVIERRGRDTIVNSAREQYDPDDFDQLLIEGETGPAYG